MHILHRKQSPQSNSGIQHIERRYNLFVAYTRDDYKDTKGQVKYIVNHSFDGYCNVFVKDASVKNAINCTRMVIDVGHPNDPTREDFNLGADDRFMQMYSKNGHIGIAETPCSIERGTFSIPSLFASGEVTRGVVALQIRIC